MFDANGSGVIHCKHFFPLLRDLGYNVHKEQAWYYMNKLELSGLSRDFRKKDLKTKVILSIDNIPLTLSNSLISQGIGQNVMHFHWNVQTTLS